MKKLSLLLSCIFSIMFILNFSTSVSAKDNKKSENIKISAFIGDFRFTLFGYTSPFAKVTLEGMGIYDTTDADKSGYFEFNNRFSPTSPREACLTAQDQFGRLTNPICLAPFSTSQNVSIGPVILPPTISLNNSTDNGAYYIGDEIVLSGQAIPNTDVSLSSFIDEKKSIFSFALIKPAYASTFPKLSAKTDNSGNFSISLPSSQVKFFRLFAQTNYLKANSGKSNTLNLKVYPIWMLIIRFFTFLFAFFKNRWIETMIMFEILAVLIYLLRSYFKPHIIARNRAIVVRDMFQLMTENNLLMKIN